MKYWGREIPKNDFVLKFWLATLIVLVQAFIFKNKAIAQIQNAEQRAGKKDTETSKYVITNNLTPTDSLILKGCLMDSFTKKPFPNGNIFLKGKSQLFGYALTDVNGYFFINEFVPKDSLAFLSLISSNPGYKTKEVKLSEFSNSIDLEIDESPHDMYFSVIAFSRWHLFKLKIKSWFRKDNE